MKGPRKMRFIRIYSVAFSFSFLLLMGVAPEGVFCQTIQNNADISDAEITAVVNNELLRDPVTDGNIDVNTVDGIVILAGTSQNLVAKERAASIASTVKGVRAVVNQISVEPALKTDEAIENDILMALMADPATDSYEIFSEVEDGHVVLTGQVESFKEKILAEKVVKRVAGVRSVQNNVIVDYPLSRPDYEIAADVREALFWNELVDEGMIEVSVENGVIKLSGTVGSLAEKNEATLTAWVMGSEAVDSTELSVARWARDEDLRKNRAIPRTDNEIQAILQEALLYDPRTLGFEMSVEVLNGVVYLSGTVDNLRARRAAEQDARNTTGVMDVSNDITVAPGGLPDSVIADRIRSAFDRNPFLEHYGQRVTVRDHVAVLEGSVDNQFEKVEAEDVAARVPGVVEVRNELLVKEPVLTGPAPLIDPVYWQEVEPVDQQIHGILKNDEEIAADIENEMFWSPYVDSTDVEVAVRNGTATLTGVVDSWLEYFSAADNAVDGGAIAVINELEVLPAFEVERWF